MAQVLNTEWYVAGTVSEGAPPAVIFRLEQGETVTVSEANFLAAVRSHLQGISGVTGTTARRTDTVRTDL